MAVASKSTSTETSSDRLVAFEVENLFGQYNYRIPINVEKHVTAIIAPNGTGKTICLRLISAFFSKKWSFFADLKFGTVKYTFQSGRQVVVRRDKSGDDNDVSAKLGVVFHIFIPDHKPIQWKPGASADQRMMRAASIERYVSFLTRRGPNRFVHDITGEIYTFFEAVETFGNYFPPSYRKQVYGDEPLALQGLISNVDCHLIETQRLLILRDDPEPYHAREQRSSLAISKKAQTLKTIVARELTAYAALSQSLDRSFPKRVIDIDQTAILAPEDLKTRLADLEKKRASLMEAGILDSEADTPVTLPEGPLADAIARVLSVYANDTTQKLDSLSKLQARIELFIELISQRFSTKSVLVSKELGFSISSHGGNVPLDQLSSGEQHQLVLFFELLFELRENALILIDEPELSLHVAWQKKFIADLNRIIALNQFDVILATHSPTLVSRWTELVVELGKVDDE
ncbi:AAA family ATPase [Rhodopseudomonas palustris]|uniref:AAA family ATPase n=1 Tax=Rhodopseudomonas palustris TaxID=1076 RepID=UPI0021F3C77A|nr:AAA family ATPase [Rhodopseudomonas palustris]UYO55692.1 AAA family ATPase [Rhodopseudomonas palustris]